MAKQDTPIDPYGWKSVQPKWLQWLKNPKVFILFLTIFSASQGIIVNGMNSAIIPTIEKEFGLSSTEAAIILSCNDISGILLVTLVSYFGGKGHRPKWIGTGSILTGVGALIYAMPKLIIGRYNPSSLRLSKHDLCLQRTLPSELSCTSSKASSHGLNMLIFCLGQLIMGAGTAPLYTLGPSFIDDNVDPKSSPVYIGLWFTATLLGPGLGILLGSSVLRVYVDLKQPAGFNLSPDDPRWLGAWWLGYFSFSWLLLIIGLVIVGYPRELPGGREKIEQAIARGDMIGKGETKDSGLKAMFTSTLRLFKNKSLIFMIFGQTVRTTQGVGIGSFVVKLLVVRFGASFFIAGISSGCVVMPAMAIGILCGSFIMKRTKLKECGSMSIKICVLVSILSCFATLNSLIPGCENTTLAGVTTSYTNGSHSLGNLTNMCNSGCHCRRDKYSPVCGADGITYFSSCHAGCSNRASKQLYQNCSCIASQTNVLGGNVKPGRCDRDCKNLGYYLFGIGIAIIVGFVGGTPHNLGVMRIVRQDEKSNALGLQFLVMRTLSFVPAPLIVGVILDNSCLLWNKDLCGNRLECLEYQVDDIILHIVIFGVVCAVASAIFYGLAWYFYVPLEVSSGNICLQLDETLKVERKEKSISQKSKVDKSESQNAFTNLGAEVEEAEE